MTPTDEITLLLEENSKIIGTTYTGSPYMAIQNIIRCIDTILPFYMHSEELSDEQVKVYRKLVEYGWPRLLKPYYFNIDINKHLPFAIMTDESVGWTTSNIIYCGKIELCKQLISYDKAGLIKFEKVNNQHYTFRFINSNNDIESFDRDSFDFFVDKIARRFVEEKRKTKYFNVKKIKTDFRKLLLNPFGQLISYDTTPEIDDYYNEEGHYRLLMMQGYDDFDNKDIFGGIEYWKYVTIVELIVGVGIKHTDACFMLKEENPKVLLENLLTYTQPKQKAISDYADYMDWSEDEIKQIFEAITLTKDNFDYYLEYPCTPPPIFIEVGGELLIRSISGCFSNPFSILNRELKRKYKKDYDKAVNNRENRFRNELFKLFPQNNVIKVPKEINISFNGIRTDIDAVVFDEATGTLGLFQLKWQDRYGYSMKERYSRISNLFPKANEWIAKIKKWISLNDSNTLLNALQIEKKLNTKTEIKEIYLFIVSRNQMNFTGVDLDETVAWTSWYQLIESLASVKTYFNDPIREMFLKIKTLHPAKRSEKESKLNTDEDFIIRFDNLTISSKP
ncbi:Uncharacterised protein [Chryseobacterium gleum]|uniref:Uncharacterized protein n=2 Tax=Chryseobacterium gleum TaxID=250 RepID=A0A3S4M773_CHRGE|nr:hypothetical protein [Chryseobacterium gleum]EFK36262.1 hypothetical protein HMPREF0204_11709 [Chryseobacterium gleum ATCC 35910]QQY33513.1 hypothetical protein I6I60_06985 [Chryseobacterium gleum]VEE08591.1 Uncharacterised protein [Chryseobacterium gleum]